MTTDSEQPKAEQPKPEKKTPAPKIEAKANSKIPPSVYELAALWSEQHDGRYLFLEGAQWWRYEGGLWTYSSVERVQASVQKFLTRKAVTDRALGKPVASVTPATVKGVLFLAQSLLGPDPLSVFDANAAWVALQNGVYDTRTHTLLPHAPENRLTHQSPFRYDPAAACPRWERFLRQVMLRTDGTVADEWIGLLQEWFGYCLIPDTSAQASMFWLGGGSNGKGTTTRVLEGLVGTDYCRAIPLEQLHDPYYRADIYGKLVGFVDEPDPKAMAKNGNFFKRIVGGDPLDARRPTEKVFNFRPTARLVISCNELPPTRDLSHGYFRRILLLEWRHKVERAAVEDDLEDALRGELPGVFNWAMAGLTRWRSRGRKFDVPPECERLVDEYRRGEDTTGRFLEEVIEDDPFGKVRSSALYASYTAWCKENGEKPLSAIHFGRQVAKRGYKDGPRKDAAGRSARYWFGLTLPGEIKEMDL